MGHSFILVFFKQTVNSVYDHYKLQKTGFEPGSSGIGSYRAVNCATNTALFYRFCCHRFFLCKKIIRQFWNFLSISDASKRQLYRNVNIGVEQPIGTGHPSVCFYKSRSSLLIILAEIKIIFYAFSFSTLSVQSVQASLAFG